MPMLISKSEWEKFERAGLVWARKILENKFHNCFYCNEPLPIKKGQVDHFIPWTYIHNNELWNLVLTCSECNGNKSSFLAPDEFLKSLANRNSKYRKDIPELEKSLLRLDREPKNWKKALEMHYRECKARPFPMIKVEDLLKRRSKPKRFTLT